MTLVAYLITDNVMAVADKMRKELEYSTKVRECSLTCEMANHPRVVSTLHNDISYKLYIVKSANQIPMDGRSFRTFSDAFNWATGGWVDDASFHVVTEDCVSPWVSASPKLKHHIVPGIKHIQTNHKKGEFYTTVIWDDGSKPTVVKLSEDDQYDLYFAVASAIAIKVYGSNSAFKRMIKEKRDGSK